MATKFEKILASAEKQKVITPAGKDYIEMALNPFPNDEVRAVGYPDGVRGRSIVRVINESFSISAPAGLVGAYDLHVFSFPEACQATMGLANSTHHVFDSVPNGWFEAGGTTPFALGLFNVILVPAGQDTLPSGSAAAVTLPTGSQVWRTNYSMYCNGPTRVIAGGFKVISTSATLYEGGSSTIYRKASQATDASFYQDAGWGQAAPVVCRQFTTPPGNLADANLIPGIVTGKAKDGAYVPLIFRDIGIARPCRYNTIVAMPTDEPDTTCPTWVRTRYVGAAPQPLGTAFSTGGPLTCIKETASDLCGVYLAGCNNEATFTVSTRAVLQTFPTITDRDLTLARPSPDNDPVALEVYKRITDEMHVAGVADSNPTGSWWRDVCRVGVAASALIPHPLFSSAVANTLPVIAGIADLTLGNSTRKAVTKSGNGRRRRVMA